MQDVDDTFAIVACMLLRRDREDYCASVGIDYGRMELYYCLVRGLNRALRLQDADKQDAVRLKRPPSRPRDAEWN